MGRGIDDLIDEVKRSHFPLPVLNGALERAEARIACSLPKDLRSFYRACGGALLFRGDTAPYEIVEPDLLRPVRLDILGEHDESVPASWISLCYMQDANYVAIDLPPKASGEVWLIDCFHETVGIPGDSTIVALSFSEFLERALASGGEAYWLSEHQSYGDAFSR